MSATARRRSSITRAASRSSSNRSPRAIRRSATSSSSRAVREGTDVEVALQWTDAVHETIFTYANNIHTVEGGTHLSGLKSALTRTLNNYGTKNNLFKNKDMRLEGDDTREGLTADRQRENRRAAVRGPDQDQARQLRGRGDGRGRWSTKSSASTSSTIPVRREARSSVAPSRPRPRARRRASAKDLVRRKGALDSGVAAGQAGRLPGKAIPRSASCSSSRATRQAAPPRRAAIASTQAILPLRGKMLNVERARIDKVLGSEQLRTLIMALGMGVGKEKDLEKLRYHNDHHHDRRRRRRLAHPHAAADVLLPPVPRNHRERLPLRRAAAAVPRQEGQAGALRQGRRRAGGLSDRPRRRGGHARSRQGQGCARAQGRGAESHWCARRCITIGCTGSSSGAPRNARSSRR